MTGFAARNRCLFRLMSATLLLVNCSSQSQGAPRPGDVFREYRWTNRQGDAGGSLRVGGRLGYGGGNIGLPHNVDLQYATRLEVVIEKLLCHDGTRGLAISVNDGPWIPVPEASGIPAPQWDYQHHTYPVVAVPLDQVRAGTGNKFRLRVSGQHPWNWPQHLIYGVHFRVFYDPARISHPEGKIISPRAGDVLGTNVTLQADVGTSNPPAARVEFLGCFDDVNLEGDGRYRQWHYHYARGHLTGHLGTATAAPWRSQWDTSWIPDQTGPLRLAAWITDETGLTWCTPAVEGLRLRRSPLSVELCKPFNIPKKWVTRAGERTEEFQIRGDLAKAIGARLVWSSWSPGYMDGIYINGHRVFDREGPRYAGYVHHVPLEDLSVLKAGVNVLKTGKTPKRNGKMVHGMEVNWPGIMVLVQYQR